MSDHPADTSAEATEVSVGGEAEGVEQTSTETPKGNPAWEGIRSELGGPVFSKIEKHLREFDSNHDRQISKLNEQYKWAKDLTANGDITPQHVTAALSLARAIDETPEQIYERLGQFLQQEGRMPASASELEAKTDDPDDPEGQQPQTNPEIAQLREEQREMKAFLQQQAFERQSQEADTRLDGELEALKANTDLNLSKDDIREILQRAVFVTHTTGKQPPLDEVAQDYVANVRNRILQTPRPGDSAPRLVPASGGNAAVSQRQSYGDMSRGDTQDLIASLIAQDNANAHG